MNVLVTLTFTSWGLSDSPQTFQPTLTTIFLTFPISETQPASDNKISPPHNTNQTNLLEGPKPKKRSEFIERVELGLNKYGPKLIEEGVGGTYIIKDAEGHNLGIFKPADEEPGALNHPKDPLEVPRLGILPGEGAIREVAAYKLDHGHRAQVPKTQLAYLKHSDFRYGSSDVVSKLGSLQRFVENDGASWDMGPSRFDTSEVHAIGQLDIRLFNMDRNGANLLVKKDGQRYRLIPIDHTYTLPDRLEGAFFEWQFWPQAKKPFDEKMKRYIEQIDIYNDAQILRSLGIREECIDTMKISTLLLKEGAKAGLNLSQIAGMMVKKPGKQMSELQEACLAVANDDMKWVNLLVAVQNLVAQKVNV